MTLVAYENCDPGFYVNALNYVSQSEVEVWDTLGNEFSTSSQTYYDNIGTLYSFEEIVKSTDRHAYPDNGYAPDYYYYILKPELTKFLVYTISPEDELVNVYLHPDRYRLPHDKTQDVDRSWEGTICGTTESTGEETIPDGYWTDYMGLYLGESIPLLHIEEQQIPPSKILGVPEYDKQINTSDTLKYGTVAAASLTVQLDEPVAEAIQHSNELYILYYDYKHNGEWDRLGFFKVDGVEAIDEYSSRLTAHDEVYKLNKYVDDFLENYSGSTTLDGFYRDLLDYCGCCYDSHRRTILNGNFELDNVYHAIKTTGIEVAHYIASLAPGFIHANIDGDLELLQYNVSAVQLTPSNMTNLTYNAYSSDLLDKVRIVSNNTILGEDSGEGENIYFISNNPLISTLTPRATLDNLADSILNTYEEIQTYRPAEIQIAYLPALSTGDMPTVTTPTGDVYKIAVMAINISGEGVKITSFGTQFYPVESESSAQFINLINDIDQVSGDVQNIERATTLIGQEVAQNTEDITTITSTVSSLETRMHAAEWNIATVSTQLQNKINNDSISTSRNLVSIKINGTTVNDITTKTYVDSVAGFCVKHGTLSYTASGSNRSVGAMYIGTPDMNWGMYIPKTTRVDDAIMYRAINGSLTSLNTTTGKEEWSSTPYLWPNFVED